MRRRGPQSLVELAGIALAAAAAFGVAKARPERRPGAVPAFAAGMRFPQRPSHRDISWLMTMDHHLLDADFIGEVRVRAVARANISASSTSGTLAPGATPDQAIATGEKIVTQVDL